MSNNCAVCGLRVLRDNFIKCEGFCGLIFHKKCAQVREESSIALQSDRNLVWRCNSCTCVSGSLLSLIVQLKNDVAEIKSQFYNCDSLVTEPKNKNKHKAHRKVSFSDSNQSVELQDSSNDVTNNTNGPAVLPPPSAPTPTPSSASSHASPKTTTTSHQTSEPAVLPSSAAPTTTPLASSSHTAPSSIQGYQPNIIFDNSADWMQVQRKKRRSGQRTFKLIGTATDDAADVSLSSVPRLKFLHLSRLSKNVTEESIISFAAHKLDLPKNVLHCKKLVKSNTDVGTLHFINFKLGIPEYAFERVLNASIWPLGVQIKKFTQHPKPKNGSSATEIQTI